MAGAKTILIVDDDHELVEGLRAVLERQGYRIIQAHDGHQAKQQIYNQRPDLVPGCNPKIVPGGRNSNVWFNPQCFAFPTPGTRGNAKRNSLEAVLATCRTERQRLISENATLLLRALTAEEAVARMQRHTPHALKMTNDRPEAS